MPDSAQKIKVSPQKNTQMVCQPDALYVHRPVKSLVGVGSTPLNLERLEPEFRGYIIFVNGYISDWFHNFGSTVYNAIMGKSPERNEGFNGGRNVNMDDLDDPKDRYKEVENSKEKLDYDDDKATNEKSEFNKKNKEGHWWTFWDGKDNKQHSLWNYWNQKENQFRFSLEYAQYFKSRGNVYYINGSHGLESAPNIRMDSGKDQGYAWAEENRPLISKKEYDKWIKKKPWLQSPEYVPITLVLHSQGNAKGLGVAQGIMEWMEKQGWKKIALNIVMLSVHQNLQLTGPEYISFLQKKKDMLANKELFNWLSSLFDDEHNKLEKTIGIDGYGFKFFNLSTWAEVKKRAVQFTFANDRGDLVMRMGDIPGIANACSADDMTNLLPFEVDALGNITYSQGRILDKYLASKTKHTYKELVKNYAKAYAAYKEREKYYQQRPYERYEFDGNTTVDYLQSYISSVIHAYSDLADAEIEVHNAPITLGLKNNEDAIIESGMSIFKLITLRGESIYYRDKSQIDRMLNI